MKQVILLTAGLFFLVSTSVFAQNTSPSEADAKKVSKLSSEAVVAYDKRDYEKALSLYTQAHNLWAHPKITFSIVKCLEELKRYREALQTAERGLTESPKAVLKARLESKIAFLKVKLTKGVLNLLVTPSGSTITIDGKVIGNAPLRPIELDAGEHKLEISHPNHAKIVQGINISGGAELKLNFTLQSVTGQLSITSTPAGADVEIDGRSWGKTPLNDLKLPVGSHIVQIKYPGYQALQRQVNISPQQGENISVVLSQGGSGPTEKGERPWTKSWPGWTALALGVAAGVGGTLFLISASQGHQSVSNLAKSPGTHSQSQKDLTTKWGQHNTEEQIGYGLAGAAGGLVVLSIILFATRAAVAPEAPTAPKTSLHTLPYNTTTPLRAQGTTLYKTP